MNALPSHQQLLFPLLKAIENEGGSASARDAINAIAEQLELPAEARKLSAPVDRGRETNLLSRRVRWVRQDAVRRGFISNAEKNAWTLTEKGKEHLRNCRPGVVVTIYETELGTALWADVQSATGIVREESVNLILTSPPYPLSTPKDYGNANGSEYLDWLAGLAADWRKLLVDDGSLVLNLGDTWNKGEPTVSLYQERLLLRLVDQLGYHLAQKFTWYNPSKIPASEWVTVKRVRVKTATENFYWLSKSPHPKADNRKVLNSYNERMRRLIAAGGEYRKLRPGGHGNTRGAFGRDNGGTIPSNLFTATNAVSNDAYCRGCRDAGLPIHPGRFPANVPEFFVKMLTEPGDMVCDFFGGSGTTAEACERLGRQWITSERSLAYVEGSQFRFPALVSA